MIRDHAAGDTVSRAVFSDCGGWRYLLSRTWGAAPPLTVVMLNPSTADERRNDPTVARCEKRARAMGAGGVAVVNLFAFRATRPEDLKRAADPVGPDADRHLMAAVAGEGAGRILCAWGVHGTHLQRAATVEAMLRAAGLPLWHLGLTRDGHPRHPLYVGHGQPLLAWQPHPAPAPAPTG